MGVASVYTAMRDPHVATLRYRLVPANTLSFDHPVPVERREEAFFVRLADDILTFEMIEHHASEESAKECVQRYLEAWRIDVGLRFGHREIGFEFLDANVIDRDPPPGTGQVIHAKIAMAGAGALDATVHVSRRQYPEPPRGFVVSPAVKSMWDRYEMYLERRDPLTDMANFCLTALETSATSAEDPRHKRSKAAKQYNIDEGVLSNLGWLAAEVGDDETARKRTHGGERRRHTEAERVWMEAAVRALIRRAGEWASDPDAQGQKLTMNDLPKLPPRS